MPSSSSGSAQPAQRSTQKAPVCPVERECGACQHVGVPYAQQLASKDTRVAELFADVADASALRPILGMDEPYYYRNKVVSPYAPGRKLQGSANARAGKGRDARGGRDGKRAQKPRREILCGMYAAGSHRIVPTDGCLIENEEAKRIIRTVRDLMPRFGIEPYREDSGTGFLRHAVVRVGHTSGEILVTLVTNGRAFPASRAFCRELVRRCPRITSVVQNVNERQTNVILGEREQTLYGPGFILDKLCGLSFRISSQSFYQVNAVQTEVLYERAIDLAGFTGSETAIDAYCDRRGHGGVGRARRAREREAQRRGERSVRGGRCRGVHARARRRRRCCGRAADGSAARRVERGVPRGRSDAGAPAHRLHLVQPDYAGARPGLFAPARLCRSHGAAGRHVPSYGSHRDDRAGGARRGLL